MDLATIKTVKKSYSLFHGNSLRKGSACFVLIGLLVFLNPFPHITAITNIISGLVLVLSVHDIHTKTIKLQWNTPFLIPLACYLTVGIISTLFALDKLESLADLFAHLIRYIALFFVTITYFNTRQRFDSLVKLIIASGIIFSTTTLFYFYIIKGNALTVRFGTEFTDSAICVMGIITVFAFILTLGKINQTREYRIKALLIAGLVPLMAASLLTQSRGTILSIITAALVIDLFRKKKISFVILPCVIIYYCFSTPLQDRIKASVSYDDRISLYLYSMEVIKDYPVFGTGFSIDTFKDTDLINPERYKQRIPEKYRSYPILWPHNMFLSLWVRTGIVGLAAYLMVLISFVKVAIGLIRHGTAPFIQTHAVYLLSALTMFCTIGLFSPIFIHFADFTFFTIFSMLSILWQLDKNPLKNSHPLEA